MKLALFIILLISGCNKETNYKTNKQALPQRIVSLGPVITEGLYLLGAEDRVVGVTVYCQKPEHAKSKEKVGTVTKANVEKIISLKPDMVFATDLSDPRQIEKLNSLGIKVVSPFSYKNKKFLQICKNFMELGKIVGRKDKANEIVFKAKQRAYSIQKKIKGLPRPKVLVQIGAKPLWVATRDSFINDFIEFAGGINIGPEGENGLYSREKVLEKNPDIIIIVTMGIAGEGEKKIWRNYKTINAVRNNRIYIIDSYKVCSPSPVGFADTLEDMVKIIHPEVITRILH